MLDAIPPSACHFVVEAAKDRTPTCFIGLAIHGEEKALAALEASAVIKGLSIGRPETDDGSLETMVLFQSATPRADILSLYRQARSGAFGALKVEVIVAPAAKAADGLDLDTDITVEDPSFIVEPSS